MEDAHLYVKEIFVDGGAQLKRLRPAPQGRGYRIRKRSNHVTLILGSRDLTAQSAKKGGKAEAKPANENVEKSESENK